MGDMAETFRAMKEAKKDRKEQNRVHATNKLVELGVDFDARAGGYHLVINHNGKVIDFWPSTLKYKFRTRKKYCCGLKKLIKELGIEYK